MSLALANTTRIAVEELKELLKSSVAFSVLCDEEIEHLADCFEFVEFTLGQAIVRAGDEGDAFYVVYSGRARVLGLDKSGEEVTVGTLNRGNGFGEQALLNNSVRSHTVRAAGEVCALRLAKEDFNDLLERQPALRPYFDKYISDISIRNFLKLSTALSPLSPNEIRELLAAMHQMEFSQNDAIIREGETGNSLFILRSGAAKVVKESQGERILTQFKPGDCFGESALLNGQRHTASVYATEASSAFCLGKSDFDRLSAASPGLQKCLRSNVTSPDSTPADQVDQQDANHSLASDDSSEAPVYEPTRKRRFPSVLQLSETDCGAACLATVLRFYGKQVSVNKLRTLANIGRDGSSLQSIAEAAEAVGFYTRGLKTSFERLAKAELPAIAHWEGFHFVVVYELKRNSVTIADPAIGLKKVSRGEFEKKWTGFLLLLKPTIKIESIEESKSTIGRFLPLLKPYGAVLFNIFLASFMLQFFGLSLPVFTQVIVDKVLVHNNVSMLNALLIGMILIAVFQTVTNALRYYLLVHTTRRLDTQMVVDFYRHILSLPMRYFEERKVGDILRRFNENARIRDFLTGRVLGVVLDSLLIFIYMGFMFYYSVKLTLISIAFIPGYIALTLVVRPIFQRQYREAFEKAAEADSQIVETVSGIGAIKSTATEMNLRWKLEGLIVKSLNLQFRSAISGMAVISTAHLWSTLNTIIVFWFAASLVIGGQLSIGQLVAFNVLVTNVTRPILSVVDLWREFQEIGIAFERLNDVFDAQPEETASNIDRMRLPRINGRIRFENVTFRYPTRPEKNALQNVTLDVTPGQTVALVGRSGAGKTTFANLLLRLYEPNDGRVLIDGHDLRHVSLGSLRSQIGVVAQDVFLFSGTIRDNIALIDADAPLEQVVEAATMAGAHDFISELPLGYETKIGERGQSLSGGQKQRIAIARALFRRPRILIFDEATSALDTESEGAIQKNLDQILKDRTTFIIAHRLSTVRNADVIVVLDRGTIREVGNHQSLMDQRGLYFYLNSQQLES